MKICNDGLIERVLGAALEVHRNLGPGLLETIYERALLVELGSKGVPARAQVPITVFYHGQELGIGFRADILVEDSLLLELKAVDSIAAVHFAQVITYLKLLDIKRGLIINFNVPLLKHGIKRISI